MPQTFIAGIRFLFHCLCAVDAEPEDISRALGRLRTQALAPLQHTSPTGIDDDHLSQNGVIIPLRWPIDLPTSAVPGKALCALVPCSFP
jgi:hypothetical protein